MHGAQRVLMINKYYYLRGGTERYVFDMTRLLERHGHTVIPFAMHCAGNAATPYSQYFVDEVSYDRAVHEARPLANVRGAMRAVYSREAQARLDALLAAARPDVAYLHNIHHQLSLSILPVLARRGVPIVWRLHDYALACPASLLFTHGAVCERCRGGHFGHCVLHACRRGSRAASLVAALAAYCDRALKLADRVALFLAPSQFVARKMVALGLPAGRVRVSPNFIDLAEFDAAFSAPTLPGPGEAGVVFCGRLSPEKGADVLIRALAHLPTARLRLIGDGPQRAELEVLAQAVAPGRVDFAGHRPTAEVVGAMREARVVVVPSLWYENCPYSILEAFAAGQAVVASAVGGIPELVEEGVTGRLFPPGDAAALARRVDELARDRATAQALGANGRARLERDFTAEAHYTRFVESVAGAR